MDVGKTHILVVDDVVDGADSTAELLTLWGYDARACYDGASALDSAWARRPDAVILDLVMPHMDGFQFAGVFRQLPRCKSIPIIAVTGYAAVAYCRRAREEGIRHYLLKPANPARLKGLLASEVASSPIHVPVFGRAPRPWQFRPMASESIPGWTWSLTSSMARGGVGV